jgi:hypothetical protein
MTYDKQEAKKINALDDSELGEGGPFLSFEFPENLTYDGAPITEMGYDGRNIYIEYEPEGEHEAWDYFFLYCDMEDDGTIVVNEYAAGLMTAREVYEESPDAPHAESLRPIYDALKDVGVKFEG